MSDLSKTRHHWDTKSEAVETLPPEAFFWNLDEVRWQFNTRVSGNPCVDWLGYTANKYFADKMPLSRCCSLGCGNGFIERSLASYNMFLHCDGYDISPRFVAMASDAAQRGGIENVSYHVADVNVMQLPASSYDAIWVHAAMHHFAALEHIALQIAGSLKPDGLLVMNDYIGPNRFQPSQRQREAANYCLNLLPDSHRKMPFGSLGLYGNGQGNHDFKCEIVFPTPDDIASRDPSEGIRSEEILHVLQQYFEIVEIRNLGGHLVPAVLEDIAVNFKQATAQDTALIRMLFGIEDALIQTGELGPYMAFIVARPVTQRDRKGGSIP